MAAEGSSTRARLRNRLAAEDGFTLPELLVVIALLPIVLVAMFNMLDTSTKLVPRGVDYAHAVDDAGVGSARILGELRQAQRIIGTTPNSVTFVVPIRGVSTQVNLSCDVTGATPSGSTVPYRRCVRTSAPVGTALPDPTKGDVVIDRLLNGTADDPVFTYTPDAIFPKYVRLLVRVPSQGEGSGGGVTHPIVIDNGTLLRNATLGT